MRDYQKKTFGLIFNPPTARCINRVCILCAILCSVWILMNSALIPLLGYLSFPVIIAQVYVQLMADLAYGEMEQKERKHAVPPLLMHAGCLILGITIAFMISIFGTDEKWRLFINLTKTHTIIQALTMGYVLVFDKTRV